MTTPRTDITVGERVQHAAKPDWGVGTVTKAESATHEGTKCQRVTVRFARAGLKTVSTAFAKLETVSGGPAIDRARDTVKSALNKPDAPEKEPTSRKPPPGMAGPAEVGPEEKPPLDPAAAREIMTSIPEPARDPFRSIEDRLRSTLDLYRYTSSGGSLLDWASAQSGEADPLSVFNRHELEQFFDRFRINLDNHASGLVRDARKAGVDVDALVASAPPSAKRAVSGGNPRR
ncbi:MAG: hypothetical protein CMJ31_06710 [Phycisphaerae bacterium]|nr:hypothetical protein [Phycisphaerae bacterium]